MDPLHLLVDKIQVFVFFRFVFANLAMYTIYTHYKKVGKFLIFLRSSLLTNANFFEQVYSKH